MRICTTVDDQAYIKMMKSYKADVQEVKLLMAKKPETFVVLSIKQFSR